MPPVMIDTTATRTRTRVTSQPKYSAAPAHTPASMRPFRLRTSILVPSVLLMGASLPLIRVWVIPDSCCGGAGAELPAAALVWRPEMTEVGVLKVVVVFQAVAEETVKANVSQPYQAESKDKRPGLPPAEGDHGCRQDSAVSEVVQLGSEPAAAQVADHEHVGD